MRFQIRNPLKTVDLLFLKEFLLALFFIFSLFVAIGFVLVLFEDLDEMRNYGATFGLGLIYVLLRLPHIVVKATPIVVVLSVVVAVGNLVRHNEMLMLYIAGYKPLRLGAPLAVVLSILIAVLFLANEYICGPFAGKAQTLMETQIKRTGQGLAGQSGIWLLGEGDRVYRAQSLFPGSKKVAGLTIFEFQGKNRTFTARLDAERAEMKPESGTWILYGVVHHQINEDGTIKRELHDKYEYYIEYTPADFTRVVLSPEQMSHGELARLVNTIQNAGENARMYLPDLRIKEAFPFAVFFLGMLAYVIALRLGRSGHASGIGLGLLVAIAYFLALSLGKSLARVGVITPWLGAWIPNLLCTIPAIYEFYKIKEEV